MRLSSRLRLVDEEHHQHQHERLHRVTIPRMREGGVVNKRIYDQRRRKKQITGSPLANHPRQSPPRQHRGGKVKRMAEILKIADATRDKRCAVCHVDGSPDKERSDGVSCEACHGPGSAHVAWAGAVQAGKAKRGDADKGMAVVLKDAATATWEIDRTTGLAKRSVPRTSHTEIETCARCHARRSVVAAGACDQRSRDFVLYLLQSGPRIRPL